MSVFTVSTQYTQTNQGFDICKLNGTPFVLVHTVRHSYRDLKIDLGDYHVVLLAPAIAERGVQINARSIIALSDITAKTGRVALNASERLVTINAQIRGKGANELSGKKGVHLTPVAHESALKRINDIRNKFAEGISSGNDRLIQEALVAVFGAVEDPEAERKDPVNTLQAFAFFSIGIKV